MKSLFALVLTLAGINFGFSQGQINFNNGSSVFIPARLCTTCGIPGFVDGAGLTGTNYLAQLYLSSDYSNVLVEGPSIFRVSSTTQPGTWSGGIRNFISAYQPGQTLSLVVRVWDGGFGGLTTFNNSFLHGQSQPFDFLIPAVGSPPSQLAMINFQGITITPLTPPIQCIPEPSALILSCLGFIAFYATRLERRKNIRGSISIISQSRP